MVSWSSQTRILLFKYAIKLFDRGIRSNFYSHPHDVAPPPRVWLSVAFSSSQRDVDYELLVHYDKSYNRCPGLSSQRRVRLSAERRICR